MEVQCARQGSQVGIVVCLALATSGQIQLKLEARQVSECIVLVAVHVQTISINLTKDHVSAQHYNNMIFNRR